MMMLFGIMHLIHISAAIDARLSRHMRSHASKQLKLQLKQADEINAETEVVMPQATRVFPSWKLIISKTPDFENNFVGLPGKVRGGKKDAVAAMATTLDGTSATKKRATIAKLQEALDDKVAKVKAVLVKRASTTDRTKIKVAFASVSFGALFKNVPLIKGCPAAPADPTARDNSYNKEEFGSVKCWIMDDGFPLKKSAPSLNQKLARILNSLREDGRKTSGVVLLDSAGDKDLAVSLAKKIIGLNNGNKVAKKKNNKKGRPYDIRIFHRPDDPWTDKIRGTAFINELNIPGTHDSAAFGFKVLKNPGEKTRPENAKDRPSDAELAYLEKEATLITQSWNFNEQLKAGIRYFDVRLGFEQDTFWNRLGLENVGWSKMKEDNPLWTTHGGDLMVKKWTWVIGSFVKHLKKMKAAKKKDFIMFTLKPERGHLTDNVGVGHSAFRHFYHYAMIEAADYIQKRHGVELTDYMVEFLPNGKPVTGTRFSAVQNKIVIVFNDYDGGIVNSVSGANADVDLSTRRAVSRGVSGIAKSVSGLASWAKRQVVG